MNKQEQEEFIKHFEFTESHSHLQNQEYDYIGFDATEVIVSDRFRQCVERLEPGRHQFLPLTMTPDSSDIEDLKFRTFYLLNCCEYVDFIDSDRTYLLVTDYPFIGKRYRFESDPPKLLAKSAAIAGHHLWKAPRNMGSRLYYSQQLRDCFCDAGIDQGYFHPMEEV